MVINNIENGPSSVVWGSTNVSIRITKEESSELRSALAVIHKYEKAAVQEFVKKNKYNPTKDSDWCEISHAVKQDKLIVKIRDGSAG